MTIIMMDHLSMAIVMVMVRQVAQEGKAVVGAMGGTVMLPIDLWTLGGRGSGRVANLRMTRIVVGKLYFLIHLLLFLSVFPLFPLFPSSL
jgi:hypothetical protein